MAIDTTQWRSFQSSRWKGLGAVLAFGLIPVSDENQRSVFEAVVGYLVLILCGVGAVSGFGRAMTLRGAILTLTPDGIHDRRMTAYPIPWSGITEISVFQGFGNDLMVLDMTPETISAAGLKAGAKAARWANAPLGIEGLSVSAAALDIDLAEVIELSLAYLEAARSATGQHSPEAGAYPGGHDA